MRAKIPMPVIKIIEIACKLSQPKETKPKGWGSGGSKFLRRKEKQRGADIRQ
jgi:hypothetical protein